MKVLINVSAKAALLEGKNVHGKQTIDIDPAELTPEERQELAQSDTLYSSDKEMGAEFDGNNGIMQGWRFTGDIEVSEASLTALKTLLNGRIEKRARIIKEKEDDRLKKINRFLVKPPEKFFDSDELGFRKSPSWSSGLCDADESPGSPEEKAAVAAHFAEIRAFCDTLRAGYKKAEEDRAEMRKQDEEFFAEKKATEEVARAEAAMRRANQIAAWVNERGTDNQIARLQAGVLPEQEIIDLIRDEAYEQLETYKRYTKLKKADVCDGDDEYDRHEVSFDVENAETMTAEEYDTVQVFKKLAPNATITLRRHIGECEECESKVDRMGIMVEITVGEFNFSREYAV